MEWFLSRFYVLVYCPHVGRIFAHAPRTIQQKILINLKKLVTDTCSYKRDKIKKLLAAFMHASISCFLRRNTVYTYKLEPARGQGLETNNRVRKRKYLATSLSVWWNLWPLTQSFRRKRGGSIVLSFKKVVRSKIFRGYVEVDRLGETGVPLLFIWSKSDKNWQRTGASNTNHWKVIFVRLWLIWKAKQSFLTSHRRIINESNSSSIETCRSSRGFRRRKLK